MRKVLLLTMLMVVSSCSTFGKYAGNVVSKPEISYKSFVLGEVNHDSIQFKPTLSVLNKNSFKLPINSVDYEIVVNKKSLSNGTATDIGVLPANGSKDVTLAIDVKKESLAALQELLYKADKIDYQVKGKVNLMGFDVPFRHSSSLFRPKVSMGKLKVSQASFSKIDMSLDVEIDNKNDFQIPFGSMQYNVSGKGKSLLSGVLKEQKIGKGKSVIRLPLSIQPSDLFSSVFALMSEPNLPLKIDVNSAIFNYSTEQNINVRNLMN